MKYFAFPMNDFYRQELLRAVLGVLAGILEDDTRATIAGVCEVLRSRELIEFPETTWRTIQHEVEIWAASGTLSDKRDFNQFCNEVDKLLRKPPSRVVDDVAPEPAKSEKPKERAKALQLF